MRIQSSQEALFIACEMERGAVQLYERAISLMAGMNRRDEPLCAALRQMLADERRHLRQFQSLYQGLDAGNERRLMLAAVAHGVLFEGGLMAAVRSGLLDDVDGLLRYAEQQEAKAVETYRLFAGQGECGEAREALLAIAQEESAHLEDLRMKRA